MQVAGLCDKVLEQHCKAVPKIARKVGFTQERAGQTEAGFRDLWVKDGWPHPGSKAPWSIPMSDS